MENFRFFNPTKILFGRDTHLQIADYIKPYANRILLVYGSHSIKQSGLHNKLITILKDQAIEYFELSDVKPNPDITLVYKGIDICKNNKIDFILAVGGGSVIDTAKTIALGASYNGDVWDFFERKEKIHNVSVKIGVILTIAAAGSETSASTVITRKDINVIQKRDFTSDLLRPIFAILNPELTLTLSREQTSCGGIDIMAHVFERYFTKVENVELTDRLCEATLKTVINNLRLLLENPENYDARAELMWAGSIAHNNLLSTGRRSDWASHMIEHEFSALYDIPHGTGLSIIFPAWMRYVYQSHLKRFVQFANKVWNIEIDRDDLEGTALKSIVYTENFFKELGQPIRFSQINITKEFFPKIAQNAIKFGQIGDFVKLGYEDIIKICMMGL